jgi:hypothetical protein
MIAQAPQTRVRRQPPAHELARYAGNENLAAVADCKQPRDPVDDRSEVVAVALLRGSRVNCGAHPNAVDRREVGARKGALRREHCSDRIFRSRKRRAKRIAVRTSASCRRKASPIAPALRSQRWVLPSMSVKANVTMPCGSRPPRSIGLGSTTALTSRGFGS